AFFSVPAPSRHILKPLSSAQSTLNVPDKPSIPAKDDDLVSKRYYLLPFFVSCSQGVLFFELPLSQTGSN
ncbi:MAG TPA: hypothetical protein DEA91_07520, partial [Paenibacillus sp.]|nr:hypothetical protein [Paenibacillus sp.]